MICLSSTNKVVDLAKAIGDYGITIVCSAVLLVFCIVMFKNQQKVVKNLQDAVEKVGSRSNDHPSEDDFEMLDLINNKIHNELSLLLQKLSCDRAYVYLYHNGGVSSSGLFFQRMSCISEVVSSGVLPLSGESQSLHRSSFSRMCNQIQRSGEWYSEDINNLKDVDGFLYQRFRSTHSESVFAAALKSCQGQVIGFIGVDYCSLSYETSSEFIRKEVRKTSSVVSTLVDLRGEVGGSIEEDTKR